MVQNSASEEQVDHAFVRFLVDSSRGFVKEKKELVGVMAVRLY
jgi:hypothetical protein